MRKLFWLALIIWNIYMCQHNWKPKKLSINDEKTRQLTYGQMPNQVQGAFFKSLMQAKGGIQLINLDSRQVEIDYKTRYITETFDEYHIKIETNIFAFPLNQVSIPCFVLYQKKIYYLEIYNLKYENRADCIWSSTYREANLENYLYY